MHILFSFMDNIQNHQWLTQEAMVGASSGGGVSLTTVSELAAAAKTAEVPNSGSGQVKYSTEAQGLGVQGLMMGEVPTQPGAEHIEAKIRDYASATALSRYRAISGPQPQTTGRQGYNVLLNTGRIVVPYGEAVLFVCPKRYNIKSTLTDQDYNDADVEKAYQNLLTGGHAVANQFYRELANGVHALKTAILAQTNDTNPFYTYSEAKIFDELVEYHVNLCRAFTWLYTARQLMGMEKLVAATAYTMYQSVKGKTFSMENQSYIAQLANQLAGTLAGRFGDLTAVGRYLERSTMCLAPRQGGGLKLIVPTGAITNPLSNADGDMTAFIRQGRALIEEFTGPTATTVNAALSAFSLWSVMPTPATEPVELYGRGELIEILQRDGIYSEYTPVSGGAHQDIVAVEVYKARAFVSPDPNEDGFDGVAAACAVDMGFPGWIASTTQPTAAGDGRCFLKMGVHGFQGRSVNIAAAFSDSQGLKMHIGFLDRSPHITAEDVVSNPVVRHEVNRYAYPVKPDVGPARTKFGTGTTGGAITRIAGFIAGSHPSETDTFCQMAGYAYATADAYPVIYKPNITGIDGYVNVYSGAAWAACEASEKIGGPLCYTSKDIVVDERVAKLLKKNSYGIHNDKVWNMFIGADAICVPVPASMQVGFLDCLSQSDSGSGLTSAAFNSLDVILAYYGKKMAMRSTSADYGFGFSTMLKALGELWGFIPFVNNQSNPLLVNTPVDQSTPAARAKAYGYTASTTEKITSLGEGEYYAT